MCALYAGGSAKCLYGATQPANVQPPIAVGTAVGLLCAVVAVAFWLTGARVPRTAVHALLGAATAVATLLAAHSTTLGGALLAAVGYQTVGLYAGCFLPRRAAAAHLVLASGGFAVGLALSGLPQVVPAWLTVTIATAAATLTLSNLIRQLHRLADHDPVTGLLNRGGLAKATASLLAAAERHGQPLAAVVIDLDGFKLINDTAGHAAGDQLLATVAARWREQLRAADVLARAGGDEFVILAPDTDDDSARGLAERLMAAAGTECSAGAASYRPGDTLSTLVSRADREMYRVKQRRRVLSLPDQREAAPST
jgi:diguanylate cyclase (GGDEF)-like protein